MRDIPLRNIEQLGMVVRTKRKEKGLSQSALASLLGVERKWVMRLEAGNRGAELALVLKALELVGIRAILRDADLAAKLNIRPSEIDEVFRRLQRPK
jgi:transcriptional regulator with XRE-family HTH domain